MMTLSQARYAENCMNVTLKSIEYGKSALCTYDKIMRAKNFITTDFYRVFMKSFGKEFAALLVDEIMAMYGMNHHFTYSSTFMFDEGTPQFGIDRTPTTIAADAAFGNLHSNRLNFYHNDFHCVDLAIRVFNSYRLIRGFDCDNDLLSALIIAALFHDVDHGHGKHSQDISNIGDALKKFDSVFNSIVKCIKPVDGYNINNVGQDFDFGLLKMTLNDAIMLIKATEYPYNKINYLGDLIDDDLAVASYLMRCCDVLQCKEADFVQSQKALQNEMINNFPNLRNLSLQEFMVESSEFVETFILRATNTDLAAKKIIGDVFEPMICHGAKRIKDASILV